MTEITERIQSRAHWQVVIRPAKFVPNRVSYEQLDEIVPEVQVRMRGWPVPYVDYSRDPLLRGEDWVGQDIDASVVDHYEAWRFFASGLFSQLRSVSAAWRTGSEAARVPEGFSGVIEIWEILFYLTEIYELATRLSLSSAGDESVVVSASLEGIENHGLVVGQPNRLDFFEPHRSHILRYTHKETISRERLVADNRSLAAQAAREFMLRFGWKPAVDQLLDHQRELTESRY